MILEFILFTLLNLIILLINLILSFGLEKIEKKEKERKGRSLIGAKEIVEDDIFKRIDEIKAKKMMEQANEDGLYEYEPSLDDLGYFTGVEKSE